jgi:hypothetical protein
MQFDGYIRKPFPVEAIEITEENINEMARFVGTVEKKEDGTSFIEVDRRLIPNLYRVYPGFFMVKMGNNMRCYSPKIFKKQFEPVVTPIQDEPNV